MIVHWIVCTLYITFYVTSYCEIRVKSVNSQKLATGPRIAGPSPLPVQESWGFEWLRMTSRLVTPDCPNFVQLSSQTQTSHIHTNSSKAKGRLSTCIGLECCTSSASSSAVHTLRAWSILKHLGAFWNTSWIFMALAQNSPGTAMFVAPVVDPSQKSRHWRKNRWSQGLKHHESRGSEALRTG